MGKKSAIRQEYEREYRRVRNAIRRVEKEGFKVDPSMIPAPAKRATRKAIEELRNITPKKLRARSDRKKYKEYYDKKSYERKRRKEFREIRERMDNLIVIDGKTYDKRNLREINGNIVDITTGEIIKEAPKKAPVSPATTDSDYIPPDTPIRPRDSFDLAGDRSVDTSIIDNILGKVDALPDERKFFEKGRHGRTSYYVDYRDRKALIKKAITDMKALDPEGTAKFFEEHNEDFNNLFDGIEYDSKGDVVERCFSRLMDLIRSGGKALSLEDIADLNDYGEGWF